MLNVLLTIHMIACVALVIAVMGDGTFGFHMAEFDTAVRCGLPFVGTGCISPHSVGAWSQGARAAGGRRRKSCHRHPPSQEPTMTFAAFRPMSLTLNTLVVAVVALVALVAAEPVSAAPVAPALSAPVQRIEIVGRRLPPVQRIVIVGQRLRPEQVAAAEAKSKAL